ncbi:ABC transporter ATP-binding protein [Arthrobacter sp. ISL-30]|nr:ABC transporter ATP-binding protein [Arthrobacter sp. ISL-30]
MDKDSHPVVQTRQLVKTFGRTRALDGLDLTVVPGEVHGFLGPNGAAKSTTLRVLLGLIRPTSGTARVFGRDPWAEPAWRHQYIAYVPGDVSLWPNLLGGEVIDLLTGLRGGADEPLRRRLIEEFEFDPRRKARTYSKGNRQKAALIAAFARPARLYLLDEPSAGLDPVMDRVFRRQVRRVSADGASVLLSSHILSAVEDMCDRVTIIRAGACVESGTLTGLRHLKRIRFRIDGSLDRALLATLPGVHDIRADGTAVEFDADAASLDSVLTGIAGSGISGISVSPPSLEWPLLCPRRLCPALRQTWLWPLLSPPALRQQGFPSAGRWWPGSPSARLACSLSPCPYWWPRPCPPAAVRMAPQGKWRPWLIFSGALGMPPERHTKVSFTSPAPGHPCCRRSDGANDPGRSRRRTPSRYLH